MIFRSLAQIVLLTVTLANALVLHSGAIDRWSNSQTASLEGSSKDKILVMPELKYAAAPAQKAKTQPSLSAKAAIVYDPTSGQALYQKNIDARLPIASLTKLTGAILIAQSHKLDEVVIVPELPKLDPSLATAGIKAGEQFSVEDLLAAVLISSSADAMSALAIWDSGTEQAFIDKMNDFTKYWQLNDTHYAGVVGLDNPSNYSSVHDLITTAQVALHNSELAKLANTQRESITSKDGKKYLLTTTDSLLARGTFHGLKTGTTEDAGQCFIGYWRDTNGKELLTVVLGSTDRFADTLSLVNTTLVDYQWL